MEIEVKLLAFLRHYLPKGSKGFSCKLQFKGKMSVADVLNELRIPEEVTQNIMVIMINGVHAKTDQILSDGDVLTVLPFLAGG